MRCGTSEYSQITTLASAIIIIYPVGVPTLYALLLFTARRTALAARQTKRTAAAALTEAAHQTSGCRVSA